VRFISDEEMPRTISGKIQHRLLRVQQESRGS
jgi:acyl-coenzyme A synthetase/AMP-(fatty) acid ligase